MQYSYCHILISRVGVKMLFGQYSIMYSFIAVLTKFIVSASYTDLVSTESYICSEAKCQKDSVKGFLTSTSSNSKSQQGFKSS